MYKRQALGLLDVDFPTTFTAYDGVSAADVLDRLRFPPGMRDLALEVFARSFFADPAEFSGGELVAMFHSYFLGSAEGLLFDVATDDFDATWWAPLGRYLTELGVETVSYTHLDVYKRQGLLIPVIGMPVEELVFFIVVPICGLLTYGAVGTVLQWSAGWRRAVRSGRRGTGAGRA